MRPDGGDEGGVGGGLSFWVATESADPGALSFWVGAPSAGTGVPQARQKALLGASVAPHLVQFGFAGIVAVGSASCASVFSSSTSGSGGAGGSYFAPHERQNAAFDASGSPHCWQERSSAPGGCASRSVIQIR